jgi:hypothetical protein
MKTPFITQFSFLFLLIFLIQFNAISQVGNQKQKSDFWQHVHLGGGIGLSFGSNYFSGTLAPSAIYRFDEKFAVGTGLSFSYGKEKYIYENIIVGASIISLFNPIPQLQISGEFEQLYVNRTFDDRFSNPDEEYWYPGLYVGAGFSTGPVTMGIRFDVLYDSERSIYANAYNPFVRFYF